MSSEEQGAGETIPYGNRRYHVYPITETELSMLVWHPIWTRWWLVRQLKRETEFEP